MSRAGKVTKPEYVWFCNRIHLLDLQASKASMERENARRAKQTLMADLIGSETKSATLDRPRLRSGAMIRRRQASPRRTSVEGEVITGSPPVESECGNTTTNGRKLGASVETSYSIIGEMQHP